MQNKALPVRIEGPIKVDAEVKAIMVGDNGKSAYEIAVAHGYKGTEQEWLDSLKGLQGPQGEPGPKGAPFRYEDFIPGQLEALKGPKGDKGNPFVYADFTTEQLEALKGPKGDKGEDGRDGASATVDNAHQLLLQGNVWCESASVDNVLTALIGNISKPFPRSDVKPLTFTQPQKGDTILFLQGEDHYKVGIDNTRPTEIINGTATIKIPTYDKDDIAVNYYNMLGEKVSHIIIAGFKKLQFTDKNGIRVFKEGNVLTVDLTNQTDNIDKNYDISDRPAWVYDGVTEFKFTSNTPNKIIGYAETSKIPVDNLYTTLNGLNNPNISTVYYQYGNDTTPVEVPINRKLYRSYIVNNQRQVQLLLEQSIRAQFSSVYKAKAVYISNPLTEQFNDVIRVVGTYYKETDDE